MLMQFYVECGWHAGRFACAIRFALTDLSHQYHGVSHDRRATRAARFDYSAAIAIEGMLALIRPCAVVAALSSC